MQLDSLSILNYKNIAQAEMSFSPKINCFIGANGGGKTNLLDSIYYLSFCKSATNPVDAQVIRHGTESMLLQGCYSDNDGSLENIVCGLKIRQKKRFKRNKKEYKRLAEHIGLLPLVMISPSDSILITGGSEERRRFMDAVISQYDHVYLEGLIRYNRSLQQRNVLLKQDAEPDVGMLSIYEEMMAVEGELIYEKRRRFVEQFEPLFQTFYYEISGGRECVSLEYTSHCQRGPLLDVIQRDRMKDRVVGYSLHGIHRDELTMCLNGFSIKREGSQGQNKTYLIAMKLAQFDFLKQTGRRTVPLLLLDDIFDKLDADRVEKIIGMVSKDSFGQIFITDTNRDHLDKILERSGQSYKVFTVDKGHIKE